jgi:hypothetical protein
MVNTIRYLAPVSAPVSATEDRRRFRTTHITMEIVNRPMTIGIALPA